MGKQKRQPGNAKRLKRQAEAQRLAELPGSPSRMAQRLVRDGKASIWVLGKPHRRQTAHDPTEQPTDGSSLAP